MFYALSISFAAFLFLFDFQNLLSWWKGRTLNPHSLPSDDFTIVIPLYGHPRYFETRDELAHLKSNVLVALDLGDGNLMTDFGDRLEAEGWRVFRTSSLESGIGAAGPPGLMKLALESGLVTTTYAVRLDADTAVGDDLRRAIASMERDGADLCSVKVLARNRCGRIVTRLQGVEYDMAMLSRRYRPWLASGACFVGKTEALKKILALHSMSYLGEDIETGRIAFALKMRVRHLNIVTETDVPDTWRGLFDQRRLWWAGNFRHLVMNCDRNILHTPAWAFYYLALVWVGIYFKAWSIVTVLPDPVAMIKGFGVLFAVYFVVTVVANLQVRSWWMLLFPAYALVQALLMPPIGLVWYLVMYRRTKNAGRYRFGYRRRPPEPDVVRALFRQLTLT